MPSSVHPDQPPLYDLKTAELGSLSPYYRSGLLDPSVHFEYTPEDSPVAATGYQQPFAFDLAAKLKGDTFVFEQICIMDIFILDPYFIQYFIN